MASQVSALAQGGLDSVSIMTPGDIDPSFARKNAHILRIRRGFGLWLWKPYFINKTLSEHPDGAMVVYADAGSSFRRDATPIFDLLARDSAGILSFVEDAANLEHMFTKRDAFVLAGADDDEFWRTPQRWAKYLFIRNSPFTRSLVSQWVRLPRAQFSFYFWLFL